MRRLFTSESVTEGHPDKICDQISDAVLDAIVAQDPMARVACETFCTTGVVNIMGEISTTAKVDIPAIARDVINDIGYDSIEKGFDGNTCKISFNFPRRAVAPVPIREKTTRTRIHRSNQQKRCRIAVCT